MRATRFFACVAMLAATQAGRVGEDGSGALWVAPELVAGASLSGPRCAATASPRPRELTFETLDRAETADAAFRIESRQLKFAWNPATGELSLANPESPREFAELLASAPAESAAPPPVCVVTVN